MKATVRDDTSGESLRVDYFPLYSLAAALADLHPLFAFEASLPLGELDVRLPAIEYACSLPCAAEPTRARNVTQPLPAKAMNRLAGIARRTTSHLHLGRRGGDTIADLPVTVLPPGQWSHGRESRKLAAAHVLPADAGISRTVLDSVAAAKEAGGEERSLPEVVRAGEPDLASIVLRALYEHLAAACEIDYVEPRVEVDSWCGGTFQEIRSPEQVAGVPGSRRGHGNCLDLSLFLAGCLECLGLRPLVVFSGDLDESPRHALLGCWRGLGPRLRPLLTDGEDLRRRIAQEELLVLEATGVCRGERRLTFPEAVGAARDHLDGSDRFHALDVSAARPPHGDVRSLSLVYSPIVQHALWAAEALRKRLEARARETLHVLYGLCASEGELTRRLLEFGGSAASRVREVIEANLPREGYAGAGEETNGYRLCVETAKLNAGKRSSAAVEEIDLLWAVLDGPSRNVRKVVEAAGGDFSRMLAELARLQARPGEATVSRVFGRPAGAGE
jgi:hypothetical protein